MAKLFSKNNYMKRYLQPNIHVVEIRPNHIMTGTPKDFNHEGDNGLDDKNPPVDEGDLLAPEFRRNIWDED